MGNFQIDRRVDVSALSTTQKTQLQQAKSADDVVKVLAQDDGKISKEEAKILAEFQAELASSSDGMVTFESSGFEAKSLTFEPQDKTRDLNADAQKEAKLFTLAKQGSTQSTEARSQQIDKLATKEEFVRFLKADQQLAGTNEGGPKTKYGDKDFTAAKILMQDAVLVESKGLLLPDDKAFLNSMLTNLKTKPPQFPSQADIQRLDKMVEKALSYMEKQVETSEIPTLKQEMDQKKAELKELPGKIKAAEKSLAETQKAIQKLEPGAKIDFKNDKVTRGRPPAKVTEVSIEAFLQEKQKSIGGMIKSLTDTIAKLDPNNPKDATEIKRLTVIANKYEGELKNVKDLESKLNDGPQEMSKLKDQQGRLPGEIKKLDQQVTSLLSASGALKTLGSQPQETLDQKKAQLKERQAKLPEQQKKLADGQQAIQKLDPSAKIDFQNNKVTYKVNGKVKEATLDAFLKEKQQNLSSTIETYKNGIAKAPDAETAKRLTDALAPFEAKLKELTSYQDTTSDIQQTTQLESDIHGLEKESIASDYNSVDSNMDKLLEESDSLMNDVSLSTSEVGKTQLQLKDQGGEKVEGGRSFTRMSEAMGKLNNQFALIKDKVMPTLDKHIETLSGKIDQRMMELTGTTNIADAQKAVAGNPDVKGKVEKDSAMIDLLAEHSHAIQNKQGLLDKLKTMADSQISGTNRMAGIKSAYIKEQERIGKIMLMRTSLAQGCVDITKLGNKLSDINSNGKLPLEAKLKQMEGLKGDAAAVCDQLTKGLDEVITKYKEKNGDADAIKLLEKQKASLEALKKGFTQPGFKLEDAVKQLESQRGEILATLEQKMGKDISYDELKALKGLDGDVTETTHKGQTLVDSIEVMIGDTKQQIQDAKDNKSEIEKNMADMDKMEKTSAAQSGIEVHAGLSYGSHVRVSLGISAGLGLDIGIAEAKIAVGVEGALTVEKSFSSGPAYLMHADIAAKIRGDISISSLFEAHAEIKAGLSAGLAFDTFKEAKDFGVELAKLTAMCSALGEIHDRESLNKMQTAIDESMSKLGKMVKEHAYTGSFVEGKIGASAGSEHSAVPGLPGGQVGLELKGGYRKNSYADGSVVKTGRYGGEVKAGEFKLEVFRETSNVVTQPPGKHLNDCQRTVVELKIPAKVLKEVMEHGSLSHLPKGAMNEIIHTLQQYNPMIAQFSAGVILSQLDKSLGNFDKKGLARLLASAEKMEHTGHSHSQVEAGVSVGVSFGTTKEGHNFFAVEFNVEAEAEFKKDIPIGTSGGFVRIEGGASAKLGLEVEVAWHGDHHEEAPKTGETPKEGGKKEEVKPAHH